MGLFLGDSEPSKIFVGDTPISKVFLGDTQVRPSGHATESIEYKMNADSNGNLYVPVSGYNRSNSVSYINCSYDWYIGVDGGTPTNYTGTGSKGGSITLSGYTAGSSHIIKITPKTMDYGWALAYGWYNTAGASNVTEVYYDGGYKGYGYTATNTSICYKYRQFYGCTALTKAPDEMLPTTVTTIGSHYRAEQYSGCTALVNAPAEVLPNTVTSIGEKFRNSQYRGCSSLIAAATEVFPNTITTIGRDFRNSQYYGCSSLTTPSIEVLPSSVTSVGYQFRANQYRECTSLTTTPVEVFPNTITSAGTNFRNWQYTGCTALTTVSGILNSDTCTFASGDFRGQQFFGCTSNKVVTVLSDIGPATPNANALQNSYVTTVRVPSAYLNNFTGASIEPWVSIDDNKFIGY